MIILPIDEEERLRSVLPDLIPLVKEGLINLVDTELIWQSPRSSSAV